MIFNYLTLAFRGLQKRALFSFINIAGLALGIGACLIILKYLDFETSYDNFNTNASTIYRVYRVSSIDGVRKTPVVWTTFGLGPALETDIPEILRTVRTHSESAVIIYYPKDGDAISFHEGEILVADSTFFKVFTFRPLEGDLMTSLDAPNSIVLTQSAATKYFGHHNPIGEAMTLAGGRMNGSYTVTAVIDDVPENSHFTFDFVLPLHNIFLSNQYRKDDGWGSNNFTTYVQLRDALQYAQVISKFPAFCATHLDPKWKEYNLNTELNLQPLQKIHLNPGMHDYVDTVSVNTLYSIGMIALFILAIAWINYINLSTARLMERAREVGIRKSIGAMRGEIVLQFLWESFVINLMGIALALIMAVAFLPVLADIIGKSLVFDFTDPRLWITLGALFLVSTLASGVYPALVMSSLSVGRRIKGNSGGNTYALRKGLVVFQFAASFILIGWTMLVYRQISFMQAQDTGLTMDQKLIVEGPGTLKWREAKHVLEVVKRAAEDIPGVKGVTTSGAVPGRGYNWGADIRRVGAELSNIRLGGVVYIDPDFIPLYGIDMVAGRNFNVAIRSDMEAVIVNEVSLRSFDLGSPEEAIHKKIVLDSDTAEIIGVAKDYNWNSLKSEVMPMIFMADTIVPALITVQLAGGSIPAAIEAVRKAYNEFIPGEPFDYSFLDESFDGQYKSDLQFGNIFSLFAGLAVVISCLGLWGLASFATARRIKEIGVRKVLGATIGSIVYLLSGQFLRLVLVAAVVAMPLAWYGMHAWLDTFAYKVNLRWDLFALPLVILLVIALATVSAQVIKGALTNPAKVLKAD